MDLYDGDSILHYNVCPHSVWKLKNPQKNPNKKIKIKSGQFFLLLILILFFFERHSKTINPKKIVHLSDSVSGLMLTAAAPKAE